MERPNSKTILGIFNYTVEGSVRSIEIEVDDNQFYNVNVPIGFFFESPNKATDIKSLPLSVEKQPNGRVKLSCFFPMSFWKNVSIILLNKSLNIQGSVKSKVPFDKAYPKDQTGYFTTFYHKGFTNYGSDWLFYESHGSG